MWFRAEEDINVLIAKGKLERAAKILSRKLDSEPRNTRIRQLLGDVLGRAGRSDEAIEVLAPLVKEYTEDGFATKAIAVVKKIQRLDPTRSDVGRLIERVQVEAEEPITEALPLVRGYDPEPEAVVIGASVFETPPSEAPSSATPPSEAPSSAPPFSKSAPAPRRSKPEATSSLDRDWFKKAAGRADFHWSPILNQLSRHELIETIGSLTLIIKHSGSIIYGEGDPANSLFVLATGFARAFERSTGRYQQAEVFEEGHFFGEEAFLAPDAGRMTTVTAASDCELLEIDLVTLREIMLTHHDVLDQLEGVFRCRPWAVAAAYGTWGTR